MLERLEHRLALAVILWDGGPTGTGTAWNSPANWVGDVLPGITDDAVIDAAFSGLAIASSSGDVTINSVTSAATLQLGGGAFSVAAASSVNALTLSFGGTLTGAGDMTVDGQLNWSGGAMRGTGRTIVSPGATATLSGVGNKFLDRTLENAGSIDYTGSNLIFSTAPGLTGTINNLANGLFNANGDGDLTRGGLAGTSANFNNAGMFRRFGDGDTRFSTGAVINNTGVAFNNSGTVSLLAGTLSLGGGGTHDPSGDIMGVASPTLELGGNHTFPAGSVITGISDLRVLSGTSTFAGALSLGGGARFLGGQLTIGGPVSLNSLEVTLGAAVFNGDVAIGNKALSITSIGTVTFNGSAPMFLTSLVQTQGTLSGSTDVYVSSSLSWSQGTMSGTGKTVIGPAAIATLSGGGRILRRRLENAGTVNLGLGGLSLGSGGGGSGAIGNLAGALFNVDHSFSFINGIGGGSGNVFDNAGTFNHSGTGSTQISTPFNNSGFVNVDEGSLSLVRGGTSSGSFVVAAGASLSFGPVLQNFAVSSRIWGPGSVNFSGGSAVSPVRMEVLSPDVGNVPAGFSSGFALGTLSLSISTSRVKLFNSTANSPGGGAEALYVDQLVVPAGTTLDLSSLHVYARTTLINGIIIGGTVSVLPDGGPIEHDNPTPGRIAAVGQVDEWTFFGRAGTAVTVIGNPGTTAPLAPLAPQLGFAEVRLIDPNNNVLSTANTASAGQIVSLSGVPIAADGIYKVQVRAAASQPNSTGNYMLTVWNATADSAPLIVNQQTSGIIETPYSVDRWTFSAQANQQVTFDWINASPPSIAFKLIGPNGFTGFTGMTGDSGPVVLPLDGSYVLEVSAGAGPGGSYAFRLLETSLTDLTLGTAYVGAVTGSGQAQLFRVNVPGQQLRIHLDDNAAVNRNELYMKFGAPPTRSDYQYRASEPSADQQLVVPAAAPGDWYILLYSEAAPFPSSFTLTATVDDLFLTRVTPDRGGTSADLVLTLTGAGFDHTTTVELVDSVGAALAPDAARSSIDLPTQATAIFTAGSVPIGTYSVRVRRTAGAEVVFPDAFQVLAGAQPRLETRLILPSDVYLREIPATLYVEYANTGDAAMPAPLLILRATDHALLSLDQHSRLIGLWAGTEGVANTSADGFSDTVQILASGATPGLLQPGEQMRIPVYYVGLAPPYNPLDDQVDVNLTTLVSDNSMPIDWSLLQNHLRPPGIGAEAWETVFANLTTQVGSTWGDYVEMLADNAQYLGRLGQHVVDVSQLWSFEMQQAIGLGPISGLARVTDMFVDAPGLPITFGRVFSANVIGRYEQGALGRGWTMTDGWQRSMSVTADGKVIVQGRDGSQRRFHPDSRTLGETYFSPDGDFASLIPQAGGAFLLREADGFQTRFRGDGKVDYVEDPNGNRITATWTGTELTRLTHNAGQFLDITYSAGRVVMLTDHAGRTVLYSYDPAGQHLIAVQGISGQTTRYTYSTGLGAAQEHGLLAIETPAQTHLLISYDARGRLSSMALDGDTERVSYLYDSAGQVTVTNALQNATKLFFNHQGLISAVEDALGRRSVLAFDDDLNLTQIIDPLGRHYDYAYDSHGNVIRTTNALGQVTAFSYTTDFNRLASVIDARGNPLNYAYDARGNLTSITYADGSAERFTLDARGEIDTWTNRRGQLVDYAVDAAGRFQRRDMPDGDFVEYSYNARGNVEEAIDASGATLVEYLDPQNPDLPTKITQPNGRFLQYTYQNGRRTQMVDQDGFTVNYLYDSAGRLEFLRDGTDNLIVQYHYDAAGRLEREDKANGTLTEYHYDAAGQLEHLINLQSAGVVNSRLDYVYDALGRRTRMTTLDGMWKYTYDAAGRLTRAVFTSATPGAIPPPDPDLEYQYDAVGNRVRTINNGVTTDYTANNLNQYTHVGTASFAYDLDGNLISRSEAGSTTTYSYDAVNRLIGVAQPGDAWSYEFDVFGDRSAAVHSGQRTEYQIDLAGLGNVVGEYDAMGALITHYMHGLTLAGRVDAAGQSFSYDVDALGSVVGMTGPVGGYVNSYRYLPFGESLTSLETVANAFGFVGGYGVMEESNGLHFMRERYYAAADGRFLNPDPIGLMGGQVNLYGYVGQNPVNLIDPLGLRPIVSYGGVATEDNLLPSGAVETVIAQTEIIYYPPGWNPDDDGEPDTLKIEPPADVTFVGTEDWRCTSTPAGGEECQRRHFFTRYDTPHPRVPDPNRPGTNPSPAPNPPPDTDDGGDGGSGGSGGMRLTFSNDPNEKIGPAGFGALRFVAPESSLPYRISFENDASATAPAYRVVIADQLDSRLDWDTFELGEVGFGNVLIFIPPGLRHFKTTAPLIMNNRAIQVEIEISLNSQTGMLQAVFQTIDPLTGLPPEGLNGFLPPEDGTGRGQGYFSYTVEPKSNLPTGTEIRNIALIVFDVNEAIATNQVDPHDPSQGTDPAKEARNTIDAGVPSSRITTPSSATTDTALTLTWTGTDDAGGSGIASFDVFVSIDSGDYVQFISDSIATTGTFQASPGHTYAFYTIAIDNVGHAEAAPTSADASIMVTAVNTNSPPTASSQFVVAIEDTPKSITLIGSDPDGDPLSYQIVTGPAHGTLSGMAPNVTYTPAPDYFGGDSFSFRVSDGELDSNLAVVSITITGVNDPPVLGAITGPTTAVPGQSVSYTAAFSDVDISDSHTVTINWGDGSMTIGTVTETIGTGLGTAVGNHTYAGHGTYTITFNLADNNQGNATRSISLAANPSIFVLNTAAGGAFTAAGTSRLNLAGRVVVDSNSPAALTATGNAHLTASSFTVAGGIRRVGNAQLIGPVTRAFVPDPLAGLVAPALGAVQAAVNVSGSASLVLNPGTYSSFNVSGNGRLTLNPGVYILAGGGFSVSGYGNVIGNGVAIVNSSSANGSTGAISFGGSARLVLSPATSGLLAGVVIFQPTDNTKSLTIGGNAVAGLNGTIYAPKALLNVIGNGSFAQTIIVDRFMLSGNGSNAASLGQGAVFVGASGLLPSSSNLDLSLTVASPSRWGTALLPKDDSEEIQALDQVFASLEIAPEKPGPRIAIFAKKFHSGAGQVQDQEEDGLLEEDFIEPLAMDQVAAQLR